MRDYITGEGDGMMRSTGGHQQRRQLADGWEQQACSEVMLQKVVRRSLGRMLLL
jgi:hypothetical protein